MSKPLMVTIPHSLGKAEAMRRLETGLAQVESTFGGSKLTAVDAKRDGDRLNVTVGVLGQTVKSRMEVLDDLVRLEVDLPWVLAIFAERAKGMIEKQGSLMLEKKK